MDAYTHASGSLETPGSVRKSIWYHCDTFVSSDAGSLQKNESLSFLVCDCLASSWKVVAILSVINIGNLAQNTNRLIGLSWEEIVIGLITNSYTEVNCYACSLFPQQSTYPGG
jgi:hypothetical protein